jgi:hypothetical protein
LQRGLRERATAAAFYRNMLAVQDDATTKSSDTKGLPETMQTHSRPRIVRNWAGKNLELLWQEFKRNASKIFVAIS